MQRSLSARDLNHAKGGSILASYLKMLPMGLIVMPGMVSRVLFPGRTGCRCPEFWPCSVGSLGGGALFPAWGRGVESGPQDHNQRDRHRGGLA